MNSRVVLAHLGADCRRALTPLFVPSELGWAIDSSRGLPGGPYRPDGLETRLDCHPKVLAAWEDLTPLARNEWICWVLWPKKAETRSNTSSDCDRAAGRKAAAVLLAWLHIERTKN
jgi:hypothetical protein